ncbi:MAG: SOS response-associated peptidase family protein, partial [Terriglobales bacterium]
LRIVRVHDLSVPGNLSRVSWKLSRTVLRGGTNSNVGPLLDQRVGKTKQPYCFEVGNAQMFAFAGIWDRWKDPSGNWVKTCSILTTTPNAVTSAVHDRMPVILDADRYDLWLDPGMLDASAASELLKPYGAQFMRRYPIGIRINHVTNDEEECSAPVALQVQHPLFS